VLISRRELLDMLWERDMRYGEFSTKNNVFSLGAGKSLGERKG